MTRLMTITIMAVLATTPVLAQDAIGQAGTRTDREPSATRPASGGDGDSILRAIADREERQRQRFRFVPEPGATHATSPWQWSDWADEICGGDSLIFYDPDENGDPEIGTVEFECLD